jgi:hypothetical protein
VRAVQEYRIDPLHSLLPLKFSGPNLSNKHTTWEQTYKV